MCSLGLEMFLWMTHKESIFFHAKNSLDLHLKLEFKCKCMHNGGTSYSTAFLPVLGVTRYKSNALQITFCCNAVVQGITNTFSVLFYPVHIQ